jgi:hypothetical protein
MPNSSVIAIPLPPSAPKALTWYLTGPMSGIPQFNFPLFMSAAKELRERGYTIISPTELDDPEDRALSLASSDGAPTALRHSWGELLSRDVKIVADEVTGLILLPQWQRSRGAKLECFVGLLCGHSFARYVPNHDPIILSPSYIKEHLP